MARDLVAAARPPLVSAASTAGVPEFADSATVAMMLTTWPPYRRGHLVDGTLGKPEEPGQVDPDDRRVVGGGVVGERLGDEHARVVDQGVDAAEASQGCIDDPLGGSALGNVRGDGDQIGVLRRLDRAGARHHRPALPPVPGDKPGADTLRASRDDSDLARHDAASPESTGAGKAYFDIAGTPNSAGRVRTITVAPRATDCACEVPGRVPWSATSRWRRRAGPARSSDVVDGVLLLESSPGITGKDLAYRRDPEWAGHEP